MPISGNQVGAGSAGLGKQKGDRGIELYASRRAMGGETACSYTATSRPTGSAAIGNPPGRHLHVPLCLQVPSSTTHGRYIHTYWA